MPVQLNHTIVAAHDARESAEFLSEILGLPAPTRFGKFVVVEAANGVSLDFWAVDREIAAQHYAFSSTETEFDEIFARITERGLTYWADPTTRQEGEINHREDGRGVYFHDPAGHLLEVLTQSYDSSLAATDG